MGQNKQYIATFIYDESPEKDFPRVMLSFKPPEGKTFKRDYVFILMDRDKQAISQQRLPFMSKNYIDLTFSLVNVPLKGFWNLVLISIISFIH